MVICLPVTAEAKLQHHEVIPRQVVALAGFVLQVVRFRSDPGCEVSCLLFMTAPAPQGQLDEGGQIGAPGGSGRLAERATFGTGFLRVIEPASERKNPSLHSQRRWESHEPAGPARGSYVRVNHIVGGVLIQ